MADSYRHVSRRRWTRLGAAVAAIGLITVVFGGISGASVSARTHHGAAAKGGGGGDLTFGLEAETTNYCLSSAQLAISGIQVVAAIYDTLTVPNSKGQAVPYLAKSVTPNADFTEWTIGLRPGVKFQDGTPVDAAAIKLNLDAFAGLNGAPNSGPLFSTILKAFVVSNTVVDPLTVKVTMSKPVTDYPNYLFATGRAGVMAPAQINAGDACKTKMIGSGPFKLQSYAQNEKTVVVKNPDYWQKGFPKANSITFVPVVDTAVRVNQLQGGQLDLMHTSSALGIDQLKGLGSQVKTLVQQPGYRELRQYFMLSGTAPFNNPDARKAFAEATDRKTINQIRNKGIFELANNLYDVKVPGYVKNAGYPAFNLKQAQADVAKVKAANGGKFDVILGTTSDPENSAEAQLLKEQLSKAGINATIAQFDQATLINKALAGDISVLIWRNLYGDYSNFADQDNYPWFANGYLTNFGHFTNDTTQSLLDQGRGAAPGAVKGIYQKLNLEMGKNVYVLPVWFVNWAIGSQPNVKVTLPPLPDGGGSPLFVYGRIPVLGLSKS